MTPRPGLDPAVAAVRSAVRRCLRDEGLTPGGGCVVVGLSGGPDSLALLAAAAFEAPRAGLRAVAGVVDHGLQPDSADVAARAAAAAERMGVEVRTLRVTVDGRDGSGPEAAARTARRSALAGLARELHADAILLGHTLDDQAETVLLGLARGSGAASLAGIAPSSVDDAGVRWARPLLGIRRTQTERACAAEGLAPWHDPHNDDTRFARVRARRSVLPVLERELGPGIAEALARTAEQLREDAEAFDRMIDETIEDIVEPAEAGISVSVAALAANPPALRHRIIRHIVASEFHESLSRAQTVEVARLAADWSGQGPIDLPACTAARVANRIVFAARA